MNIRYVGTAKGFVTKDGREVRPDHTVRYRDSDQELRYDPWKQLPMRNDLRNHSPDGANWGYLGSGPAQLALAILANATGSDEMAAAMYQDFKAEVVSRWAMDDDWEMEQIEVLAWVADWQRTHPPVDQDEVVQFNTGVGNGTPTEGHGGPAT